MVIILNWLQTMLSLNRFEGFFSLSVPQWFALVMQLSTALIRWIASLALINESSFTFQAFTAIIASLLVGSATIITYNNACALPSRQQRGSLIIVTVTTFLWETIARMSMRMMTC